MKNLVEQSKIDQLKFINSFDHVLSDLDGVLWLSFQPFPGSADCIKSLIRLNKNVHYVTNNSTGPVELVKSRLAKMGLETNKDDIVLPILAIVSHLKKIKFDKELYVIGTNFEKQYLREHGFLVAADGPQEISENLPSIIVNISDNLNVAGVLLDSDINVNFIKLQKAVTYLKRKDCIFISAAADAKLPVRDHGHLIGPHYFFKPVIELSGREPIQIAKPSIHYNEYITEKFNITDPTRVLFIGDSVNEDMSFATKCGYQKLLVLSGNTKSEHISNWEFPEEYKPDYYVENLNVFGGIINNCTSSRY